MLARYGGSVAAMLDDTLPEVTQTTPSKRYLYTLYRLKRFILSFCAEPAHFWDDIKNRQQFLQEFAAKMKFDPMNPENWRDTLPVLRSFGVRLYSLLFANLPSQGAQLLDKYVDIYKLLYETFPEMKFEQPGLCCTFFPF